MIPLRDNIPTLRFSYMTHVFIALNFVVFLYELTLGSTQLQEFILRWGYTPDSITHAIRIGHLDLAVYATLLTSIFIHAGWIHILGNMLYLYIFGNNVEDSMGHFRFVVFYLLIGALANFGEILVAPHSNVPGIGASGAIAGILGAYLLLYPRAGVLVLVPIFLIFPIFTLPAAVVLIFWFVLQVFEGTLSLAAGQAGGGGVAFWVHLTGFVLGMALIYAFRNRRLVESKPTSTSPTWT